MKEVSVESVPHELLRRIKADAAVHFKLAAEPRATAAWQILNPYSKVLCIQLTSEGWSNRVFAKLPLRPIGPSSRFPTMIGKEFEILRTLAEADLPVGGAGTVIPLAYYVDIPSMVTLEAIGPTLRNEYSHGARVFALPRRRELLGARVALCGQWLRSFHERTDAGMGGFDEDELLAYCQIRLERVCLRESSVLTRVDVARLVHAAKVLARSIPDNTLRLSGRHNDFASHNIIACGDGGIRVLDFTMFDQGPNAFDVCNFWFELEMLKCDPTYSRSLLSRLQSVFLESYGGISPDAPEFVLARLRYAINRLLNALSDTRRTRWMSPHRWLTIRRIKEWLRDFAIQSIDG